MVARNRQVIIACDHWTDARDHLRRLFGTESWNEAVKTDKLNPRPYQIGDVTFTHYDYKVSFLGMWAVERAAKFREHASTKGWLLSEG